MGIVGASKGNVAFDQSIYPRQVRTAVYEANDRLERMPVNKGQAYWHRSNEQRLRLLGTQHMSLFALRTACFSGTGVAAKKEETSIHSLGGRLAKCHMGERTEKRVNPMRGGPHRCEISKRFAEGYPESVTYRATKWRSRFQGLPRLTAGRRSLRNGASRASQADDRNERSGSQKPEGMPQKRSLTFIQYKQGIVADNQG